MPKLSIIIPSYNSGSNLIASLDSIICQTFCDFEVLIIDAKSTDQTVNIVHQYTEAFKYIYFFSGYDQRIYDAMNKGVDRSTGEWLYFLGSGDYFLSENTLADIFDSLTDCDVVYGNVFSPRYGSCYDGEFTVDKLITKNICHQSIFTKREVFKRIGGFNLKYNALADWDFNLRWFLNNSINKKHKNILVAYYADNGYSTMHKDILFGRDKRYNIIRYGWGTLNARLLLELCAAELNCAYSNSIFKSMLLRILICYSVLRLIRSKIL